MLHPLRRFTYVIMQTKKRFYIGEVLDIYNRGANSRHGSIDKADSIQGLSYLSLRVYLPVIIGVVSIQVTFNCFLCWC
jgi:hypothetical protein